MVSCGEPMAGNNSWVMYNQTTFAENASYECNLGYESDVDNATRTCGADRNWSGDPLNCRRESIYACIAKHLILYRATIFILPHPVKSK